MKTFPIADIFKGRKFTTEVSSFRCNHCGQPFFVHETRKERELFGLKAIPCPFCKKSIFALHLMQFGIIVIRVDSEEARRLASYSLIERDLTDVVMACKRLLKALEKIDVDEIVCASLWTHALTKYARCFLGAHGKRQPLDIAKILKRQDGDSSELQRRHKYFLTYRNKHIAHSINAFEQASVGVVVSAPDEDNKQVFEVGVLNYRVPYSMGPIVTQLLGLAACCIAFVNDEIDRQRIKVLDEMKTKSFSELYKLPKLALKANFIDPSKDRKA